MKKQILLLLIAILSLGTGIAQTNFLRSGKESLLYDSVGRLRADTTIRIDTILLPKIRKIEEGFLPSLYRHLKYPIIALEFDIEGTVIVKIEASKDNGKIRFIIHQGVDSSLEKHLIKCFNKEYGLLHYFLYPLNKKEITLYIPFKFEVKDPLLYENLRKNKAITIKGRKVLHETSILGEATP